MGGIVGGIVGGIGAKKAAKQQRRDIQSAAGELSPYAQGGLRAQSALESSLGLAPGDTSGAEGLQRFRDSSGYQDTLNRSLRGVAASGAAQGLLGSTGTGERFQRTAAELANSTRDSYLSRLFGLQQAGQSAAANRAQLIAGKPASRGTVLQGLGANLNSIFLGPPRG